MKLAKVHSRVWQNFLTAENPLEMVKNPSCFMTKSLFLPKMFTFLSWFFGHVSKWLDKKTKVNFNIYDVANWTANTYKYPFCPISQEVKTIRQ